MKTALLSMAGVLITGITTTVQAQDVTAKQIAFSNNSSQKNVPAAATKDWQTAAQEYITASEYYFKKLNNQYATANRKQQVSFATDGLTASTSRMIFNKDANTTAWKSSLQLVQINNKKVAGLPAHQSLTNNDNHLRFHYNNFDVEYINNEQGIRQNFIITNKPEKDQPLKIVLHVSGDLVPSTSNNMLSLTDKHSGKTALQYDDLKVWDANHKPLTASMQMMDDHQLALVVNDADAVYPVTVDPLTHLAEWEASAAGILPTLLTNLQLQVDAMFGFTMAGIGDINDDGYDDVAIGAPGAIDVIVGPGTVVGAGAVFIYYGSTNGLAATPDRVLRSTSPVLNALFGFSIAGGNVVGTAKNDIIVGAPGESYSTTVSGLPATATVTAGKVYVFNGETLTSGSTTPYASVYLRGSTYFSRGVLGAFLSNININPLFGFSVAATDDMNGDGLGEIVVGAPGYAGVQLLDVVSGAAFVYYSGNIASNTPTQLAPPSLLSYPGMLNLNGLLFGFSVDCAGDYNKDSRPDIVVGAPGGASLSLGNLLGGSAYVYNGNGTGVNTSIGTQLTAPGSLVGSVANLFGYSVRGVRDAYGFHNGNILVGAPTGNVLSNIVSGLRLKAGSVNLFASKPSPAAKETSTQVLSSPRASSLLSILSLQNINMSALFGASIDNMLDVNCDGVADIIVGEPLSSAVGLVGANAVGGAAFIFTGKWDGTYNAAPYWTLENEIAFDFGINAASLTGYSVAGGGHVRGYSKSVKALVGSPGKALDFSTGIFNLGNTLGTLFGFTSGGNGLGKAGVYTFTGCSVLSANAINFTATQVSCDAELVWKLDSKENYIYTEIEQSVDGRKFTVANRLQATSGKIRLSQPAAQAYYRLRVYDKTGQFKTSEIAIVKTSCNDTKDKIAVLPSVFVNNPTVIFTTASAKGAAVMSVQDVYGRTVTKTNVSLATGANRFDLNTTALTSGFYYVSISGNGWTSGTVKVIKGK